MANIFRRALAVTRTRVDAAAKRRRLSPRVGEVDFGDLRRTSPVSSVFGLDRGKPIDRHYVESFLAINSALIRGRVLEVASREYTTRFGGKSVATSEVLHLTGETPDTTIVADLTDAAEIPDGSFDCVILTQTLNFVYPVAAAVSELHRILGPGGCVLCTVGGISQISRFDMERWGDYWRFTSASARNLFETVFEPSDVEVSTYGNVLSATALLQGLATSELSRAELDCHDDDYQVIVAVRATKPAA